MKKYITPHTHVETLTTVHILLTSGSGNEPQSKGQGAAQIYAL